MRQIRLHRGTDAEIRVLDGRYGPYVTDGSTNATIPRGTDPTSVSLEDAVNLLHERAARGPAKKRAKKAPAKKKATKTTKASKAKKSTKAKSPRAPRKKPPATSAAVIASMAVIPDDSDGSNGRLPAEVVSEPS